MLFSNIAASHSSITAWHPVHTFPLLPGITPVTPVCNCRRSVCSGREAKLWTVAVSHCLCAWQRSSQPPLHSHQEMSFSNSFSNALNSSLLSSDKARSKRDPLLAFASAPLALTVCLHRLNTLIFLSTGTGNPAKTTTLSHLQLFSNKTKVMLEAVLTLRQ